MTSRGELAGRNGDKTTILHVIPRLGHGGAEHQLALNVSLLDRERFESVVCYMHPDPVLTTEFREAGAPLVSVEASGPFRWANWVLKIRELIGDRGVDVVHTTNAEAWLAGGLAGRLSGTPVIATLNNSAYDESWLFDNPHLNRLKLWYSKNRTRVALQLFCSKFVAISRFVKDSHVERLGLSADDIAVVYRGAPQRFFDPVGGDLSALKEELGLPGAFPVLLNVARLVPQKGQAYAIEAMPAILEQYPVARLLLVGVGFKEAELRDLTADLGVDDHVNFLGSRRDIRELHAVSDMFLFPSNYEGFGAALGEAMAAGNTCVVSGVPPLTELIEDGVSGVHVAPRDPAAIAETVVALSADSERRARLAAGARARALAAFTIEKAVRDLEAVYDALTKAGGTS